MIFEHVGLFGIPPVTLRLLTDIRQVTPSLLAAEQPSNPGGMFSSAPRPSAMDFASDELRRLPREELYARAEACKQAASGGAMPAAAPDTGDAGCAQSGLAAAEEEAANGEATAKRAAAMERELAEVGALHQAAVCGGDADRADAAAQMAAALKLAGVGIPEALR